MLAVIGTIPEKDFPLVAGEVTLEGDEISIQGKRTRVNRGTPALLAATIKTLNMFGQDRSFAYLIGDIGLGYGSRKLYEYLTEHLSELDFRTIVFHYIQPDVDWCNRIMLALEKLSKHLILIADAGFMYAAKMSGQASKFDLFTPDPGELAFLADEDAPHPFYTRGFILHEDNRVPELISRAYSNDNAARCLLVKGRRDYIADKEKILYTIDFPMDEAMEAIGGTGDTLTGIVSVLLETGIEIGEAAFIAAKVNRLAGYYARPTPATQVIDIIEQIPRALKEILGERSSTINTITEVTHKDTL